jgi:hypothetical protein
MELLFKYRDGVIFLLLEIMQIDRNWLATYSSDANFGSPMYSANSYTDGAGFGNFSYAVPTGYLSLCTKNLSEVNS